MAIVADLEGQDTSESIIANMDYYEIPTWKDYQHYKDRDPPWIKLHFSLLTSSTWVMLDDASRVLAIACILIASRNKGKVPANPDYIRRVAYLTSVDFAPLVSAGFLKESNEMLADASKSKHSVAKATTEERRGETETEKEEQIPTSSDAVASSAEPEESAGKVIFETALDVLAPLPDRTIRSLVGKARKLLDDIDVLAILETCRKEQPAEPASFFAACIKNRAAKSPKQSYVPVKEVGGVSEKIFCN